MSKIVVISPHVPKYKETTGKSALSSLANQGYIRVPGTGKAIIPHKEASGAYRTGLDEKANYIKHLSAEAKESELAKIQELKEKLQNTSGFDGINLSSTSKVWDVWGNEPIKASLRKGTNESIYLNLDDPQDLLDYCWLRVNPEIAKSKSAIEKGECPECQYYLADEEQETQLSYKKKKEINKATSALDNMTPTELKRIGRLLGFPITESTTEEKTYSLIDDLLKKSEFQSGEYKGRNTITVFNELAELSKDELEIRDLVKKAIRHNIYRIKGDQVTEGSNVIADSESNLVRKLLNTDNQRDLLALKARLSQKTAND